MASDAQAHTARQRRDPAGTTRVDSDPAATLPVRGLTSGLFAAPTSVRRRRPGTCYAVGAASRALPPPRDRGTQHSRPSERRVAWKGAASASLLPFHKRRSDMEPIAAPASRARTARPSSTRSPRAPADHARRHAAPGRAGGPRGVGGSQDARACPVVTRARCALRPGRAGCGPGPDRSRGPGPGAGKWSPIRRCRARPR
jgi:hypothetical protein